MSMTKEEYQQKRAEIDSQIDNLKAERATLDRKYALTLTDIRVGDRIEYGYDKRMLAEVVGIDLWGRDGIKCSVRRTKKDGSLSEFVTEVYSYHNPKKI